MVEIDYLYSAKDFTDIGGGSCLNEFMDRKWIFLLGLPVQYESYLTSLLKRRAHSFNPSTIVR